MLAYSPPVYNNKVVLSKIMSKIIPISFQEYLRKRKSRNGHFYVVTGKGKDDAEHT